MESRCKKQTQRDAMKSTKKSTKKGYKTSIYLSSDDLQMMSSLISYHHRNMSNLIHILLLQEYNRIKSLIEEESEQ